MQCSQGKEANEVTRLSYLNILVKHMWQNCAERQVFLFSWFFIEHEIEEVSQV